MDSRPKILHSKNPVVRTTKTVLARQGLIAKTATQPKVLNSSTSSSIIKSSIASSISRPSYAVLPKKKESKAIAVKEDKPAFAIPYNIRGPQVPNDADFRDFDKEMSSNLLFMGRYVCLSERIGVPYMLKTITMRPKFNQNICGLRRMISLIHCGSQRETLHLAIIGIFNRFLEDESKHHVISKYLLELSRIDYAFCPVKPSLVAAAALGTALCIVEGKEAPDDSIWSKSPVFYTTYTLKDVKPYIASLAKLVLKAETSKLKGVYKKYASSKQMKISIYLSGKSGLLKSLSEVRED